MGQILEMAKKDARGYVNSGGFETELLITPQDGYEIAVKGLMTNHTNGYDTEGKPLLSKQIQCSFSEIDLNQEGLTTRDSNGNLNIKNMIVRFTDSINDECYKISETHPDDLLGIIRCTLSRYEQD